MNEHEEMQKWLDSLIITLEEIENETHTCDYCGREFNGVAFEWNGNTYCEDCRDEHIYVCDCCGELVLDEDAVYYRDRVYCNACVEQYFETCVDCGELVRRRDAYEIGWDEYVCEDCREENYRYCYDCDTLHHIDNLIWDEDTEEYYCESCWNDRISRAIHDYHYKPVPIFHGGDSNALFMGVELEVDKGGEDSDNAEILLDTMNACNEHIYIKHDGSLSDGFEIVSHPATLDYHLNEMQWSKLMESALAMDYRSHETETCGLHVHVSRQALGDTYDERETTIAKILYFIENHWWKIVRFTRRKDENLSRWASAYGMEDSVLRTYDKAKNDYCRYRCLNLLNERTIEFRVFRGTLKASTFYATLQFVNDLCEICKRESMDTIATMTWYDFCAAIPAAHTYLIEYLKERNLFNMGV